MKDQTVMVKPNIGKALAMIAAQRIATPAVLTKAEKTFTDDLASHKISFKEKERTEVIDANDDGTVINRQPDQ